MDQSYTDCLLVAQAELITAQRLLAREISVYPTPTPDAGIESR